MIAVANLLPLWLFIPIMWHPGRRLQVPRAPESASTAGRDYAQIMLTVAYQRDRCGLHVRCKSITH